MLKFYNVKIGIFKNQMTIYTILVYDEITYEINILSLNKFQDQH